MKTINSFVCQECGYDSPKYLGKCPECGAWNSMKEFREAKLSGKERSSSQIRISLEPKTLQEILLQPTTTTKRLLTGFAEMDTVLGGGLVPGEVVLLAGDPGVGKSTLLLQVALLISHGVQSETTAGPVGRNPHPTASSRQVGTAGAGGGTPTLATRSKISENQLVNQRKSVLYISGEESEQQVSLRANRLSQELDGNLTILSATNTDAIVTVIADKKPDLVIIDSIQTMESEALEGLAGSVAQVRYSALSFIRCAKQNNIPTILVGHVTKEGMVAGPMVLSHMVDTVLFLEGEKNTGTRILRSLKNRFGPVDEVGVFTMQGVGLAELKNPETLFLPEQKKAVAGSVMVAPLEGTRAFLVEVQALVVGTKLPIPRHVALGIDPKRLELLLAILQKQAGVPLFGMDVFVNIAGGLKVSDPAIDLGVCLAIASSFSNTVLSKTVGIAEVGLLGELRNVPFLEKRVKQAQALGFTTVVTAKTHSTIRDVVKELSLGGKSDKSWQQSDERHWKRD